MPDTTYQNKDITSNLLTLAAEANELRPDNLSRLVFGGGILGYGRLRE